VKLDVYGRFQLEVQRENAQGAVPQIIDGMHLEVADAIIPAHFGETEINSYIDDLYHETARPGQSVRRVG
jgi:hypothetical protein